MSWPSLSEPERLSRVHDAFYPWLGDMFDRDDFRSPQRRSHPSTHVLVGNGSPHCPNAARLAPLSPCLPSCRLWFRERDGARCRGRRSTAGCRSGAERTCRQGSDHVPTPKQGDGSGPSRRRHASARNPCRCTSSTQGIRWIAGLGHPRGVRRGMHIAAQGQWCRASSTAGSASRTSRGASVR